MYPSSSSGNNNGNNRTPAIEFTPAFDFSDNSPDLSGSDAQRTMPITPNVGMDVFLTTHTNSLGNIYHNSHIGSLPIDVVTTVASTAALVAATAQAGSEPSGIHNGFTEMLSRSGDTSGASNIVAFQEYPPMAFGTIASTVHSENLQTLTRPLEKMHGLLDGILSNVSTPLAQTPPFPSSSAVHGHAGVQNEAIQIEGSPLSLFSGLSYMPNQPAQTPSFFQEGGGSHLFAPIEAVAGNNSNNIPSFSLPTAPSQTLMYPSPVTRFTHVPDERLFGQLNYADNNADTTGICSSGSNTAANPAFASGEVATAGRMATVDAAILAGQIGLHEHAHLGNVGQSNNISAFVLSQGLQHTPSSLQSEALRYAAITPSLTSGFGNISLGAEQTPQSFSFQVPRRAASHASRLSSMRPKRSLSSGKIAHMRSSPLASAPSTSVHPYFPRSSCASPSLPLSGVDIPIASPQLDRLNSYVGLSSEATGCAAEEQDVKRSGHSSPSAWGMFSTAAASAADEGSQHLSDDASSDHNASVERRSSASNRIPLTSEQREIFFRWLHENAHDPKPKGKERDRLRSIGNMSRERFKTWFANARRRYFNVATNMDGEQSYTINERFKIACQRANIKLE
ncbi:hypothetical protein GGI25_000115 [Coemansia spiralis]|uniref:Homeobox domain-containing protein n=2 Tax=Coemansia TaxID=4863 RepID=A0A9W8L0V3_9FUNG|nr:hypothetical protein BX070DRAFT_11079 [Coemansia spiralis]KAJ1992444.1 hypothetical protein EDC05_002760 [Coemansia umbellata]KAJ2620305.1 hypothetical protein GGI26_005129 [Coemansia sp. RSA 1358]KAJ2681160.1 hypothetical protein GGI25_000115 [Coemansia spiralis]